jgi:hypothetical protein
VLAEVPPVFLPWCENLLVGINDVFSPTVIALTAAIISGIELEAAKC